MKRLALLTGLAGLVLLSGCNTLANLAIQTPVYHLRGVTPRVDVALPLSASSIDLTFDVDIENPNPVGLTLDRMDFELFVNGSSLLRDVSTQNVRIPAQGVGNFDLRMRIGYNEIQSLWREVTDVIQGNRARYEVRGTAFFDTPAGPLSFPLTLYRSGN